MAKKRVGVPEGLAEGSARVRTEAGQFGSIDLRSQLDAILARRRGAEEDTRAAARRAEVERRAAAALRVAQFNRWIKARTQLRSVIVEVEALLFPLGLYLGMADEGSHPAILAAVEIRLYVYGRPCTVCLDLTVSEEGCQTVCDVGGPGPAHHTRLPDISCVTADHYRAAVLAYVERALPGEATTAIPACRMCGRRVREIDGS